MKRENSVDGKVADIEKVSKRSKREPEKVNFPLNMDDLGAGYEKDEKRVTRAVIYYDSKLIPYIEENYSVFKGSNFLKLKGYATNLVEEH